MNSSDKKCRFRANSQLVDRDQLAHLVRQARRHIQGRYPNKRVPVRLKRYTDAGGRPWVTVKFKPYKFWVWRDYRLPGVKGRLAWRNKSDYVA